MEWPEATAAESKFHFSVVVTGWVMVVFQPTGSFTINKAHSTVVFPLRFTQVSQSPPLRVCVGPRDFTTTHSELWVISDCAFFLFQWCHNRQQEHTAVGNESTSLLHLFLLPTWWTVSTFSIDPLYRKLHTNMDNKNVNGWTTNSLIILPHCDCLVGVRNCTLCL